MPTLHSIAPQRLQRTRANKCATALCLLAALSCAAQEKPEYTFRIYTNLVQLPVLILGPKLDYAPRVDPKKLTISVDGGKPFPATYVRPEGDDPIELAILLDSEANSFLGDFPKAIARIATRTLHPQDNVAIYTMNCTLDRVAAFKPADATALMVLGEQALSAMKHHKACDHPMYLRNSLAVISDEFSNQPGRRVILAISGGKDNGSSINAEELNHYMTYAGVAVFGLAPSQYDMKTMGGSRRSQGTAFQSTLPINENFDLLCKNSGGLAQLTTSEDLPFALQKVIKTLRRRYIVEFPRPAEATTAGIHNVVIAIAKSLDDIRPTGIGMPLPDPKHPDDPNTIQSEVPPTSETSAAGTSTPPQ